ncbi:MAG: hypothetical protein IJ830_06565 [Alphaproteobacteria bacterium]|nr:hypothetical protein [Alphaproteobacteria bacterium]
MRNNQTGRSMVEMLGVLAIIGVLSAGGLAGYSKAMFKHKLNTTMEQITMLVTNIRTAYGTQKNYNGLTNEKALGLGIIPPVMGTTTTLTNPFKGNVTILAAPAKKGVADTGFVVGYTKLPKEACIALATADFGSGAGSGFVGVDVLAANTTVTADASTVFIGTGDGTFDNDGKLQANSTSRTEGQAYQMSAAITACSEQATIIWKFY